jgi:hypothetical protein
MLILLSQRMRIMKTRMISRILNSSLEKIKSLLIKIIIAKM